MRKLTRLALSVAVLAGMGVGVTQAQGTTAQGTTQKGKKSSTAQTASPAPRGKSRKGSSRKSSRGERGQKTPTSDRIREIQQALGKDGSYPGTASGKWDAASVEAMKKYQSAHGLTPSGKLDAKTLQKLGLGSQTAGVAAPMPPFSSSNRLTPPSAQTARRQ